MTPAQYYDWWFYSGICPGIPTRAANYATLRERLSVAGVHLIVLWELLLDNSEVDDDGRYILPVQIHGSHECIVVAAREVGALRLADNVAARPDSTVVPETRREVKALLKEFATRHKSALASDVARHGDSRATPDFDKRKARRKRDEQWGENSLCYQIVDQIPFFTEPMNELRTFLSKGMVLTEISKQNDGMAQLACCLQYDFPRWAESPQPVEVRRFLEECRRLTEQHPGQLPTWGSAWKAINQQYDKPHSPPPEVSPDRNVLDQLDLIGLYKAEHLGPMTVISWDSVPALNNTIAPTGLRLAYEGEFPARFLPAWPDAQRRFAAALPRMSAELLALGQERVADDELRPPDDQLLAQVTKGMLSMTLQAQEPDERLECSWEVEWDPEHGCTFEIDNHGGVLRTE